LSSEPEDGAFDGERGIHDEKGAFDTGIGAFDKAQNYIKKVLLGTFILTRILEWGDVKEVEVPEKTIITREDSTVEQDMFTHGPRRYLYRMRVTIEEKKELEDLEAEKERLYLYIYEENMHWKDVVFIEILNFHYQQHQSHPWVCDLQLMSTADPFEITYPFEPRPWRVTYYITRDRWVISAYYSVKVLCEAERAPLEKRDYDLQESVSVSDGWSKTTADKQTKELEEEASVSDELTKTTMSALTKNLPESVSVSDEITKQIVNVTKYDIKEPWVQVSDGYSISIVNKVIRELQEEVSAIDGYSFTERGVEIRRLFETVHVSDMTVLPEMEWSENYYLQKDFHTINGLEARKLLPQAGTSVDVVAYEKNGNNECWIGFRAWIRHEDESETELTDGDVCAVHKVSLSTIHELVAPHLITQTLIEPTDALVIKVYARQTDDPDWTELDTWISNQLPDRIGFATSNWNFHYFVQRTYTMETNKTKLFFYFGNATYSSRVNYIRFQQKIWQYHIFESVPVRIQEDMFIGGYYEEWEYRDDEGPYIEPSDPELGERPVIVTDDYYYVIIMAWGATLKNGSVMQSTLEPKYWEAILKNGVITESTLQPKYWEGTLKNGVSDTTSTLHNVIETLCNGVVDSNLST